MKRFANDNVDRHTLLTMLPDDPIQPCFYVTSNDPDVHPDHTFGFCERHADMVAKVEAIFVGASMHIAEAWAGSDYSERCQWHDCDIALDAGGLTDYGIDSALGLTEKNPDACHVYPAELVLAYQSMLRDDARWAQWEKHARRLTFGKRRRGR